MNVEEAEKAWRKCAKDFNEARILYQQVNDGRKIAKKAYREICDAFNKAKKHYSETRKSVIEANINRRCGVNEERKDEFYLDFKNNFNYLFSKYEDRDKAFLTAWHKFITETLRDALSIAGYSGSGGSDHITYTKALNTYRRYGHYMGSVGYQDIQAQYTDKLDRDVSDERT